MGARLPEELQEVNVDWNRTSKGKWPERWWSSGLYPKGYPCPGKEAAHDAGSTRTLLWLHFQNSICLI